MKSGLLRGSSVSFSSSRRALVQPRFLAAAMTLAVGGAAYLATAQTGRAPVAMKSASATSSTQGPVSLADLPGMVSALGESRQKTAASAAATMTGRVTQAIGTGQSGYNLVESDLTPNSPSDEREPVYSPSGDFIAFTSNGKDADLDGTIDSDAINAENKTHIWVMNRDGSDQRQISGLNTSDKARNQTHPSWSPDGNQLVYVDGDGATSQLYVAEPFVNGTDPADTPPVPERRTFFTGTKKSPAWAPSGLAIVFACDSNVDTTTPTAQGQYDLFTVSPNDVNAVPIRLTGGTNDPLGNSTDDWNPAFSAVNQDVLYFSSNRSYSNGKAGVLATGRRIWSMNAGGGGLVQVSDPTRRTAGLATDVDDHPSASLGENLSERIAFESNSFIDASDVTHDLNIWAFPHSTLANNPYTEGEARVFASDYSGNEIVTSNPQTGNAGLNYQNIPGVTSAEGEVVVGRYIYAASGGTGQIQRFDQETAVGVPGYDTTLNGNRTGSNFTDPGSVPDASGLITDGNYFYVGSGLGSTAKVAVYRFDSLGNPQGLAAGSGAFTYGEDAGGAITNGTEGLAFSANNGNRFIYASVYSDNKINVYNRSTGQFVKTFAIQDPLNKVLDGPTGLAFGPDLNGDTYPDLYVNASNKDSVLAFAGPNPTDANLTKNVGVGGTTAPGTLISTFITDNQGSMTNLNAPEGIQIIPRTDSSRVYFYVSSFQNRGLGTPSIPGTGDHINRYYIDTTTIDPADPTTQVAVSDPNPNLASFNIPNDATFLKFTGANGAATKGIGYFDFNALARSGLETSTGVPAPTPTPIPRTTAYEGTGTALVQTNILSSPTNYGQSGLATQPTGQTDIVGQDKADDREPAFSRTATTAQLEARLAFASNRLYAPLPSSNKLDSDGNKAAPSNPFGSNGSTGTNDIWGASAEDTTPPALIPQATGNQLYPFLAPGPQAPHADSAHPEYDPAPRTYEEGLRPGGPLRVALVLNDAESGVKLTTFSKAVPPVKTTPQVVLVTIRQAGTERFTSYTENVDEAVSVNMKREGRPDVLANNSFYLDVYDDGPPSQGGHELQADAIAGDGIYYCDGTGVAPSTTGDFYIDVRAADQKGNFFTYDNIWGFSTQPFQKGSSGTTDLFVSDYTCGQSFPLNLVSGEDDTRFANMFPVESYYLTNTGGQAGAAVSIPQTFSNVDVWRVICRGPVPQTVFDSYRPTVTTQIDPAETKPGPLGPYTAKSRKIASSKNAVIWAAPYAGTTFVGPGTITDTETQTRLKTFLDAGGRLFLSGRDVAFALSDNGQANNSFLTDELGANFSGEASTNLINQASAGSGFIFYNNAKGDAYKDLQIPYHWDALDNENWSDAALSQNPYPGTSTGNSGFGAEVGTKVDLLTPTGKGTTTTDYTLNGSVVGQRVEQTRTNGLKSRVVFFSFGFEAVNRRYRKATTDWGLVQLDVRNRMANQILQYFKTGAFSGTVINDKTNEPIPNFLLKITGGGDTYLVRTDSKGEYTISGLPPGGYNVVPALLLNGKLSTAATAETSPPGFFAGTPTGTVVTGGTISTDVNLRPIPNTPGSLSGKVVTSKGTPTDFVDDLDIDEKSVGMNVLVRSLTATATTKGGGKYAQLTKTDSAGRFAFTQVPAGIPLQVIFNPTVNDIPSESGLRAGFSGPNTTFGRRLIPDNRRPDDLEVPVSDAYVVNDPDPVKYPDPDKAPIANGPDGDTKADSGIPIVVPEGPSISGVVTLDGAIAPGATVDLLDSKGNPLPAPRSKQTGADGRYVFADVLPGTYQVRGTATTSDGVTASQTQTIIVQQGVDFSQDIPILLSDVSGNVTLNGANAGAGTAVTLYNVDGTIFIPTRKAITDASGAYKLTAVPNGKYRVNAFKDQNSGSSAIITINNHDLTGVNINMINRQLSGVIQLSVDGGKAAPLQGARVELVTESSKSLNPPVVVTTDKDGVYSITENTTGRYRIIASYGGDSLVSGVVTVQGTATNGPALTLALENLSVKVIDNRGKSVSSASLQLLLNNVPVQTAVADGIGTHTFALLPAGTYTVSAAKGNLGGSGTINVKRLKKPALLTVMLGGDTSGSTNPTGFNVKGKIYYISIPYEDTNSPASSNVSEKIGKVQPATTKVRSAFTVLPVDPDTGQQNYLLQRYDPISMTFVDVDDNGSITRGVGYLLQVINKGTSLVMPGTTGVNRTRIALTDPATAKTFTVVLHMNPSVQGNIDNGRNLIGFGFDPDRYSSVSWTTATFKNPNGQTATSLQDAVNKGWVKSQISTLDSSGAQPKTVNASALKPFGGYFVQTKVDGLQVTFNNPTKN